MKSYIEWAIENFDPTKTIYPPRPPRPVDDLKKYYPGQNLDRKRGVSGVTQPSKPNDLSNAQILDPIASELFRSGIDTSSDMAVMHWLMRKLGDYRKAKEYINNWKREGLI
jgi:hypothetical protein